jgi:integrase
MRLGARAARSAHGAVYLRHAAHDVRDAIADELLDTNPCVLKRGELPKKIDKNPLWRPGAVFTKQEVEAAISDERIPLDRRVVYALLFLGGLRFGEAAALRWRSYQDDARPLGRFLVAASYNTKKRVEKSVKIERAREVPVHPTLAKVLAAWKLSGWASVMGRRPTSDDLLIPSRRGTNRNSNHGLRRFHEDLARLGIRARRQHDLRRTFISLARSDGARKDVLEWVTHGPRGDIVDLYTTLPWELLCDEVAKLQMELRSGKVIAFPKAASGGEGSATFLQPVLHELGPPSNDATSQNKSAERLSGEGGIRTRGPR